MSSKTNVTGRDKGRQKQHYCPECGEPSVMTQHRLPGKSMWGHCKQGHQYPKKELVLR